MSINFPKIIIITGHYGSGKTNVAVNVALFLSASGKKVTVIDMDIVNPYFRTADFGELFESNGIALKAPMYANSNLDIPALNYDISSIVNGDGYVIIDVGGDDAGATALGRYSDVLKNRDDVKMYCVINKYRYVGDGIDDETSMLRNIEAASGLKCGAIINNSNIGVATTAEAVKNSLEYADEVSELLGVPVAFTSTKEDFIAEIENGFEIKVFVKPIWEN